MRTLVALFVMVFAAFEVAGAQERAQPVLKAGYVHCTTIEAYEKQRRLQQEANHETWLIYLDRAGCHVSDYGKPVKIERLEKRRNIVCLKSDEWEGCHYTEPKAVASPRHER